METLKFRRGMTIGRRGAVRLDQAKHSDSADFVKVPVMARLGRVVVFAPTEIAGCHIMSRVVRHCFLLGYNPVSGKNFDHRKLWIEERLRLMSANFGIDLLRSAFRSPISDNS